MTDDKLDKLLSQSVIDAPETKAKNQAKRAALAEFSRVMEEKSLTEENSYQGNKSEPRPISQTQHESFGRKPMKKLLHWVLTASAQSRSMQLAMGVIVLGLAVTLALPEVKNKNSELQSLQETNMSAGIDGKSDKSKNLREESADKLGAKANEPAPAPPPQEKKQVMRNIAVGQIVSSEESISGASIGIGPSGSAGGSGGTYSTQASNSPAKGLVQGFVKEGLEKRGRLNEMALADSIDYESDMAVEMESPASAPLIQSASPSFVSSARKKEKVAGKMRHFIGAEDRDDNIAVDTLQVMDKDIGRDQFEEVEAYPTKRVDEEPVSTFSVDVDTSSYSVVRRALHNGYFPSKAAIRVEELINYFDYDYDVPQDKAEPFKPSVSIFPTPWNPETKLLHVGIKGYDIEPDEKPSSNLVFLLDVSGSMNNSDKLPLLKNAFRLMIEEGGLNSDDTVAIVVYAGAAGTVLEPTKISEKHKILAALDRLNAGGSTAGGEGIRQAYALAEQNFDKNAVNRVILATDGDFNVGIRNKNELKGFIERKRNTGIFLSVLGFGQGNYNDALMQKLAQNGNGNAAYIDNLMEARKVLVDEVSSTLFPIAKDVKIQVEFNPDMVEEYRLIGYETRALRREDFNNDKVDAGDIGAGHSVTAIYEITPKGSKSVRVDELRYGSKTQDEDKKPLAKKSPDFTNEYAFLKLRYKLPNEDKSQLITRPVTQKDSVEALASAPAEARFAAAVTAYGELLRGSPYLNNFSFDDVRTLADPVRGQDSFGYRAEFMQLLRLAKSSSTMQRN